MKEWPNSFWAAIFVFTACTVGVIALFSKSTNAGPVITMASSIVTGAFGYIQGRADGKSAAQDMPPNSSLQQTTKIQTPPDNSASKLPEELP